ncbi:MAG: nitrogen fixation protein NifQ [Candidatus Promineifilaceae bacterium]
MSRVRLATETLEQVFSRLMIARRGDANEETLARILASWSQGMGSMPQWLGLGEEEYQRMMRYHFPNIDTRTISGADTQGDMTRGAELQDLRTLLMENRSGHSDSESWMAEIVTAGCMGSDHLWQDLGLWNRADLSKLMWRDFAPLAQLNDKDMKWKKFLYKQLCDAEGIYTCRAPSCEVCLDYDNCFGSE